MFFKTLAMTKITLLLISFFSVFTTVTAQFTQNFEGGTTTPDGWTVVNGGDVNTWTFGAPGNGPANSGNNVAKILFSNVTAHNDYLVTPQINVTTGVNDRITFWVRNRSAANIELFNVKVSTSTPSLANFTATLLGTTAATQTWTKMTMNLTPYVGQSIYVGFHAISYNLWEFYLDDIINDSLCDYGAPIISSVIQPNCSTAGSASLSGLPSSGVWTLYTTRSTLGVANSTVTTTTSGTGTSTTVPISNENYNGRIYSYHFIAQDGCQSPESNQVFINKKYDFQQWIEGTYQDTNNDGIVNLGDQIIYNVILRNFGNCDVGNSNITLGTDPGFTQFDSLGTLNFPGNSAQQFDVPYTITGNDISNGYVNCGLQINPLGVGYGFSNSILNTTTPLNTNGIRLNAFVDSNYNGIKEAFEPTFAFGDFHYTKNSGIPVTVNSSNGSYLIPEWDPANSYSISFEVNPIFSNYLTSNTSLSGITSTAGTGITDYYFPVTYLDTTGDLMVNVIPIGTSPRPGFEYKNRIAYLNSFSFPVGGTLTFTKDNSVTINSVSQLGVVNNPSGFSYNFNLQPFETGYIDVVMEVSASSVLGSSLTNTASITIPANDTYPQNNDSSLIQTIVNSYDPNNKIETHGGEILFSTFSTNDYLTYTINFENTGTANAINIQLTDNLDFRLDENSLTMVCASHNCVLEKSGNFLRWRFNGIQLIPTGKGFITFKIKIKPGYAPGTIVQNTANIYFDSNPAITTNVCTTEFVTTLDNKDFTFNELSYFPNPVKNSLFIRNTSIIAEVEISSVLGQKIMSQNVNNLESEINLSNLPNGIYFVKVKSGGASKTIKIIKK